MKELLLLIITVFSATSYATSLHPDTHKLTYSPDFKIASIESMCPSSIPTDVHCMALGQIVVLEATLKGCLDTISTYKSNTQTYGDTAVISINSQALSHPDNIRVFCNALPVITKRIVVPEMNIKHFKLGRNLVRYRTYKPNGNRYTKYPLNFKIVSLTPICSQVEGSMNCMAIGSKLVIKASLGGCLDTLAGFKTSQYLQGSKLNLNIYAMGLSNPESDRVRCIKIPEVTKTITVPVNNIRDIIIKNISI
jgi:hypothetical protein